MLFKHLDMLGILQCFILWVASVISESEFPVSHNLSIRWRNEFCGTLWWPSLVGNQGKCKRFQVTVKIGEKEKVFLREKPETIEWCESTEARVQYSVKPIDCTHRAQREPAMIMTIPQHTELVKDFQCSLYSSKDMNCSWCPTNHVSDLQFYYWYTGKVHTSACTEYLYSDGVKTGCHLGEGTGFEKENVDLYFLVNGTLNSSPVRNIFLKKPMDSVKPPPPKMNITKEGRSLVLSWAQPDIGGSDCWTYVWNYTRCGEIMVPKESRARDEISYDPRCQYQFQVKAVYSNNCGKGESDLSSVQTYGADEADDWSMILAAIFVPLLVFLFVFTALVCLRRHKSMIFPDIPEPRLIFKDMMKNNSKSQGNLYIPVQEEVECKISLEANPLPTQTN